MAGQDNRKVTNIELEGACFLCYKRGENGRARGSRLGCSSEVAGSSTGMGRGEAKDDIQKLFQLLNVDPNPDKFIMPGLTNKVEGATEPFGVKGSTCAECAKEIEDLFFNLNQLQVSLGSIRSRISGVDEGSEMNMYSSLKAPSSKIQFPFVKDLRDALLLKLREGEVITMSVAASLLMPDARAEPLLLPRQEEEVQEEQGGNGLVIENNDGLNNEIVAGTNARTEEATNFNLQSDAASETLQQPSGAAASSRRGRGRPRKQGVVASSSLPPVETGARKRRAAFEKANNNVHSWTKTIKKSNRLETPMLNENIQGNVESASIIPHRNITDTSGNEEGERSMLALDLSVPVQEQQPPNSLAAPERRESTSGDSDTTEIATMPNEEESRDNRVTRSSESQPQTPETVEVRQNYRSVVAIMPQRRQVPPGPPSISIIEDDEVQIVGEVRTAGGSNSNNQNANSNTFSRPFPQPVRLRTTARISTGGYNPLAFRAAMRERILQHEQ